VTIEAVLLRMDLRGAATEVASARSAVRQVVEAAGHVVDAEAVELLTSELLANASEHGSGPVVLEVIDQGSTLRVQVVDAGCLDQTEARRRRAAALAPVSLTASRGRGLAVVARLAADWDLTSRDGHTIAWFEMPWQPTRDAMPSS
jgi:anti-sigma regulatory factor (Ser/Thr protein kinase)